MRLIKYKGILGNRDSSFDDFRNKLHQKEIITEEIDLDRILSELENELTRSKGVYNAYQGATITPEPLWKITIKSIIRRSGSVEERAVSYTHLTLPTN